MTQKDAAIEERLVIRITPDRKERLRRVADFLGQTMTTFTTRTIDARIEQVEAEMPKQEAEAA